MTNPLDGFGSETQAFILPDGTPALGVLVGEIEIPVGPASPEMALMAIDEIEKKILALRYHPDRMGLGLMIAMALDVFHHHVLAAAVMVFAEDPSNENGELVRMAFGEMRDRVRKEG